MVFYLSFLQHEFLGKICQSLWLTWPPKHHFAIETLEIVGIPDLVFNNYNNMFNKPGIPFLFVSSNVYTGEFVLHKLSSIFQYLSVITIKIQVRKKDFQSIKVTLLSRSASFLPTWFPFVSLFTVLFCWIPFSDFGCNEVYLLEIIKLIDKKPIESKDEIISNVNNGSDFGSLLFFLGFIILPVLIVLLILLTIEPNKIS